MPFYNDLRPKSDSDKRDYALVFPKMTVTEKKRTINGLLRLKTGLAKLPNKKCDENLLIASWNIKEFGHTKQRLPEAYFYIAEIVSAFDLVAVQEIKSTLVDLEILVRILGSSWDYVINDVTNGRDGNQERSAYLFNRERVRLSGLAGEITLWDDLTADSEVKQLKRAPYITGFKAGWKSFAMVNLHLHPGDSDDDVAYRAEEVRLLIEVFKEKTKRKHLWTQNIVLVGDFNFYDEDADTIGNIEASGFHQIGSLAGLDTNASKTESYDRFFLTENDYFCIEKEAGGAESAGVVNPFDFVYRDGGHAPYTKTMQAQYGGNKTEAEFLATIDKYYKQPWRKNQVSDHFPIWFELCIDSSGEFLESKLAAF
ncbi:MAG: endonuclease/exonuclease/phosphatase family protein [Gammaproteobacteria bacterium]|nr:endonuclease/exonuclease/phosphatase family protein [Gammaproteobacteria bacterium]